MKQHLRDDIVCVLREELLALSMMKEIFKPTILCEIEDHLSVVPPHMTHTQFSPLEDPCQAIIQTHLYTTKNVVIASPMLAFSSAKFPRKSLGICSQLWHFEGMNWSVDLT